MDKARTLAEEKYREVDNEFSGGTKGNGEGGTGMSP